MPVGLVGVDCTNGGAEMKTLPYRIEDIVEVLVGYDKGAHATVEFIDSRCVWVYLFDKYNIRLGPDTNPFPIIRHDYDGDCKKSRNTGLCSHPGRFDLRQSYTHDEVKLIVAVRRSLRAPEVLG
jgi:hypothetical protein